MFEILVQIRNKMIDISYFADHLWQTLRQLRQVIQFVNEIRLSSNGKNSIKIYDSKYGPHCIFNYHLITCIKSSKTNLSLQ